MAVKIPSYMVDSANAITTPSQITSTTNNLTFSETTTILRLFSNASQVVTGFAGGTAGRPVVVQNVGSNDIVFAHANSLSTSTNRFNLGNGSNLTLTAGKSVQFYYDATVGSQIWRDLGSSPAATTTSNTVVWTPVTANGTGTAQNITIPENGLTENDLYVSINGLLQTPQTDYTLANTTLTITSHSGGNIVIRKNLGPQGTGSGYGGLSITNNLSDVQSASIARANLGLGNVANASIATILSNITGSTLTSALGYSPIANTAIANTTLFWSGTDNTNVVTTKTLYDSAVPQVLGTTGTITWNAQNGFNAKTTMTGNITLSAITNPKVGVTYALELIQDATGSRTCTWNSAYDFGGAGTPTLSTGANKRDIAFMYCYDASTPKFRVSFSKDS